VEEDFNSAKEVIKGVVKIFLKKGLLLIIILVAIILILVSALYVTKKEDIEKANIPYVATVTPNGELQYYYTDPVTSEKKEIELTEMSSEIHTVLGKYIDGDEKYSKEKIEYLIGAETVTKLPYIEPEKNNSQITGQIKFYRFSEEVDPNSIYQTDGNGKQTVKEQYRLKYIYPYEFTKKMEEYNSTGNTEIFKYFTINEDGDIVIAFGSQETRKITTQDQDITLELVQEQSGEDYKQKNDGSFEKIKYSVEDKVIDYLSLVEQYVMPTSLLYSFLIQTGDIEFVEAIAKLAYDNEIAVAIYDNKSEIIEKEDYEYKKAINLGIGSVLGFEQLKTTNPAITEEDLKTETYSKLPYAYVTSSKDGKATQKMQYYNEDETAEDIKTYDVYVTEIDEYGQVSSLGTLDKAVSFSIHYEQTTRGNLTPTVDIVLADTWVGRWKAFFEKEEQALEEELLGEGNIGTFALKRLDNWEYTFSYEIRSLINSNISSGMDELKAKAIDKIIESTTFTVVLPEPNYITVEDITNEQKKQIIKEHIDTCEECRAIIDELWETTKTEEATEEDKLQAILILMKMPEGANLKPAFAEHYADSLNQYVENHNAIEASRTEESELQRLKDEFRKELQEQIEVTYAIQECNKELVNINYKNTSKQKMETHKKQGTTELDKIGEKFSAVFNNKEFYSAKQAILEMKAWFFEYIREDEESAKLENVIRYLLNVATDSEEFGQFVEGNVEDTFKIFTPDDMSTTGKFYGNTVEEKIWNALIEAGYSEYAVAGVLGNLQQESNLRTNNLQNSKEKTLGYTDESYTDAINRGEYTLQQFTKDGAGYGLAQWTSGGRKQGLYNFAKSRGVSIDDIDMQIEFLLGEISPNGGADGYARKQVLPYSGFTRNDWTDAKSPEDAAEAFCYTYERPSKPAVENRKSNARVYYNKFKGTGASGGFIRNTKDSRIIGTFKSSITGKTFTIFNQLKIDGWGQCCNRAAQISICSGYSDDSYDQLIGSIKNTAPRDSGMYDKCGLKFSVQAKQMEAPYTFSTSKIKEQLKNGGYITLYVRGYWMDEDATGISKYGRDWAGPAHWVAILGYRDTYSKEEIFVSDSALGLTGWVPLDEFEGITSMVVFINEK